MIWNPPRRPQRNGIVERAQGTTQRWSDPGNCTDVKLLQQKLDSAVEIQRGQYPLREGCTRLELHPQLCCNPRRYRGDREGEGFDVKRVGRYLAQGCWNRRVDKSGLISIYNRNHYVGGRYAGQLVAIRFDPDAWQWVVLSHDGQILRRHDATELTVTGIVHLEVTRRKSKNPRGKTLRR